ncbi:MAG TPA: chromate efflux transporter [Myxococcales bacterium]|nr:chromate efflux transporter [Myxococcales bacterium]
MTGLPGGGPSGASVRYRDLAAFFARLGLTAFGGPAVHIALMEATVVRERRWMPRERFLDLLGAANLIPGPSSTELAIYIGYDLGGPVGLLIAGICFILPAALVTLAFAWAYVRFGALPHAAGLLAGMKPVIIAVLLQALFSLAKVAAKTWQLAALGAAAAAAALAGVSQLGILLAAGVLALAARRRAPSTGGTAAVLIPAVGIPAAATAALQAPGLVGLFLVFAKTGAFLFGSGYVLLAFLRRDLVDRLHWLTEAQLLDAVAVGQITPGPVFTTATFIGYLLSGVPGAAAATLGIFAPAFVLVAASGFIVPRLRRSAAAGAFLDGVNVAALGLMAAVAWELGRAALIAPWTIAVAAVSGVLLIRFRASPVWLLLAGAALGILRG